MGGGEGYPLLRPVFYHESVIWAVFWLRYAPPRYAKSSLVYKGNGLRRGAK